MTLLHNKYTSFVSCGCREEDFFMYFHDIMVDNDMPGAWPVWTPGALLAGFMKRSTINCSTQNMKALGHVVSKKILFYVFPIVSLWELLIPRCGSIFDPRGMIGRIYVKLQITMLHTKYRSFGTCSFREDFPL